MTLLQDKIETQQLRLDETSRFLAAAEQKALDLEKVIVMTIKDFLYFTNKWRRVLKPQKPKLPNWRRNTRSSPKMGFDRGEKP